MAEKDDLDEWLDDVETDDDGELDQLNIDALLSAGDDEPQASSSAASELDQTNIDALLGITEDEAPAQDMNIDELDQDNIDALLGNQKDEPAQEISEESSEAPGSESSEAIDLDELDQDNIDALLNGSDDNLDELDQDNIDALLGDSDGNIDELDQDNIDALLSGESSPAAAELEPAKIAEPDEDLDQSNIDELLATDDIPAEEAAVPDQADDLFAEDGAPEASGSDDAEQDDIDALFNDIDAATAGDDDTFGVGSGDQSIDELFTEDDTGDNTTLSAAAADEIAETAFDSEFDEMDQLFSELEDDTGDEDDPFQAEEIDFAEMLDSSGNSGDDEFLEIGDDDDEDEFAMAPEADDEGDETDIDALLAADEEESRNETENATAGIAIPAFISGMGKTTISAIGGGLALLLLFGLYFMFSGDDPEDMATIPSQSNEVAQQAATTMQKNFIPTAEDSTYAMDNTGTGLPIVLQGSDADGQPLIFQVTSQPAHGRLSGTAPDFTYLANSDFPGEDSFEYTVNDGIDTSAVALVTITGPDLKEMALAQKIAEAEKKKNEPKKVFKPKKPMVLAKNVHFYTASTAPVTIDWRRIWKEANKSDYDPKIHVEIVKAETAGSLGSTKNSKTVFTPDPYSGRTDLIFYRFKKDGFRSATKTISIDIELGNPAPEINLAQLQPGYPVGHNVQLDTSPSRDDSPANLQFSWEQVSGVPVSMHISPDNGRKMDFVMPSSFYSQKDSGPVFNITATDKTGKTTSRQVKIKTISRRQAALWRGTNGGVAEEPAMKGRYFPWPYDDD